MHPARRLLLIFVAALLPVFPCSALADDAKAPGDCKEYLKEMKADLDWLEALVPNVPHDEASYLEKEYDAALKAKSDKRIFDLEHRPYYWAWNFHDEFYNLRLDIDLSQQSILANDIEFAIKIASKIPYRMTNAQVAWNNFDRADNGKVLSDNQIQQGAYRSTAMAALPGKYIWCLANFIGDGKK